MVFEESDLQFNGELSNYYVRELFRDTFGLGYRCIIRDEHMVTFYFKHLILLVRLPCKAPFSSLPITVNFLHSE